MSIHPTAKVDPKAQFGDVQVEAYAVIGSGVSLADGVRVGPHAVIYGPTSIGEGTQISAHAVIGGAPQDDRHDDSVETRLVIGRDTVIREFCTIHRGSSAVRGLTRVGDGVYMMARCHVGCDATVGDRVTLATGAVLGGHVDVGPGAVLGLGATVHQYCRVGRLAMVAQGAMCTQDVPPFSLAQGDRARLFGLNVRGLKRSAISPEAVGSLKQAWRTLFSEGLPLKAALARVRGSSVAEVEELVEFASSSTRGIARSVGRSS